MYNRIIIIPKDDLVYYPPTISLIKILTKQGLMVECVGEYSDSTGKALLEAKGVTFVPIARKLKDESKYRLINWIVIIRRLFKYKKEIKCYLSSANICDNALIWFVHSDSIGFLQKHIEKYHYVVQFYEFEDYSLSGVGKLIHPRYDVRRYLRKAKALIHCEYNRAMITNGLYGINSEPFILPNKPYEDESTPSVSIPEEVSRIITEVNDRIGGKKVILYQGIFDPNERRLNEFCEAMSILPKDYFFIAMGGGGGYFAEMKMKYGNDRILFIPFIRPPHHLHITQLARYGVLTYHPANHSYAGVINPLYCAPNKIFEFGKYGIPMIANDVPGLKLLFETYRCGKTVSMPLTPQKIADTVLAMEDNYGDLSKGSRAYYDSVDIEAIVNSIVNV